MFFAKNKFLSLSAAAVFFMLQAVNAGAADMVEASASADKKEMKLGDVLRYTVSVKRGMKSGAIRARQPEIKPPSFDGFRLAGTSSQNRVNIINNNASMITQIHYNLVAIKSGKVTIGEARVKFYDPETKSEKTIKTKPVSVNVLKGGKRYKPAVPTPTPTTVLYSDIKTIKMELDLRLSDILPYIILGIIFLMAVIAAAYFIFRKKPEGKSEKLPQDYRAEAIKRVRKAEEYLKRGDVKGFYYGIYEAVRYFLSNRYNENLDGLTTQEIIRKLKDKKAGGAILNEIRVFMKDCDFVKFADYKPKKEEINSVYDRAEAIILKI